MTVQNTDTKDLLIEVTDINDVTGPTNVSPASYAVGWRAAVRNGTIDNGRTFVVILSAAGTHVWKEQLTAGAGDKPDQRFTVATGGYDLNAPGVNTWLTPEDGIAAAFAGTGTTLPAVSGAEQRFVWIHPALYDGNQAAVALHAWVHLVGCADGAEAAILQNYEFTFSESGDITISGLYFSNCTFVFSGTGNIRFQDCRFELCSLSHASGEGVGYVFDNCQGTIPSWTIDTTGLAVFSIIGSQKTTIGSFAAPITMETTTIAMNVDFAVVELSITGDVEFNYSGTYLCDVTTGSFFVLIVDRAKLTSTGPKGFLFNIAGGSAQAGVITRGNAILPQTQYVASTFDATSLVQLDYAQYASDGDTMGQYWPTGIVGPGLVSQATSSGSRPRGFTSIVAMLCEPGSALATQTAAIGYGGYDRILARPGYRPLALNPNTASPNFQFASLLLVDPKNIPIGHTIDVVNDRTTTANQDNIVGGPIALRLPNGTTSRIGFMVSDVSVNPIFTSDNYVILEPGQSCTLTVSQDMVTNAYLYNVSGIGADTNALTGLESQDGPLVESDWFATTKDCWTLLGILPRFQGSNSSAGFAFMPVHSLLCSGARFYWASAVAGTVKVRIRSAAGAPLVDVDVPVNGIGDYTATFAAPIALTALTRYWITTYLTSGTGWTSGISGGAPARFLVAPQPMRGWVRLTGMCNSNGGGDVLPTASVLAEQPMLLVPTFYR